MERLFQCMLFCGTVDALNYVSSITVTPITTILETTGMQSHLLKQQQLIKTQRGMLHSLKWSQMPLSEGRDTNV